MLKKPKSETQLHQSLDSYFSKESHKNLVFSHLFESNHSYHLLFILKYMYSHMKITQFSCHILQIATYCLRVFKNPAKFIKQFDEYFTNEDSEEESLCLVNESKIFYLTRFISIPTIFMNLSSNPKAMNEDVMKAKSEFKWLERQYFGSLAMNIDMLQSENQVYILNKLLVLNYTAIVMDALLDCNKLSLIVNNFEDIMKKDQILKYLYLSHFNKKHQAQELLLIINKLITNCNLTRQIISLLSSTEPTFFQTQNYLLFFHTFMLAPSKFDYFQEVFNHLLKWWCVSKNYLITDNQSKFRCNLLAVSIQKIDKEKFIKNQYTVSITQGIQRKLSEPSQKQYAILIWKYLALKLNLEITKLIQKAELFIIDESPALQTQNQQIQLMKEQKKNVQNNDIISDNGDQSKNEKKEDVKSINSSDEENEKEENKGEFDQQEQDIITIKLKQPINIYDCILGLRNPQRQALAIKSLPKIIKQNTQDLTIMWTSLMTELLNPLDSKYKQSLTLLFVLRPLDFIEVISSSFFKKDTNISEKICFMEILSNGIVQLSQNPNHAQQLQEESKDYFFKKIKSNYYVEKPQQPEKKNNQEKTRRWGHTRIAHEQKMKESSSCIKSLLIVKSQPYINRFYEIANALFFKIISRLQNDIGKSLKKHQILAQNILKLMSTLTENLKNHFEKYLILRDVGQFCLLILTEIAKNEESSTRIQNNGANTLMLTLQVLNKLSLVVDKFMPEGMLETVKQSVEKLKKMNNYGIKPIVELIEANFYKNVFVS